MYVTATFAGRGHLIKSKVMNIYQIVLRPKFGNDVMEKEWNILMNVFELMPMQHKSDPILVLYKGKMYGHMLHK